MPFRRRALLLDAMAAVAALPLMPRRANARGRVPRRSQHRSRSRPMVMIDPGHGGKDPGCIGVDGTEEKNIVLALGLQLERELVASGRFRVAMTRHSDVFIPLAHRVALAQQHHAALFISLHANASRDTKACGACVYRFAYRASDASSAAMARWENNADRYGGRAFHQASPTVLRILASLMRRETWIHSALLQKSIVTDLQRCMRPRPVSEDHARFVVLSAPDIPSVLIESGFLTNPAEAKLLRNPHHRLRMAQEIRSGAEHYLARL